MYYESFYHHEDNDYKVSVRKVQLLISNEVQQLFYNIAKNNTAADQLHNSNYFTL